MPAVRMDGRLPQISGYQCHRKSGGFRNEEDDADILRGKLDAVLEQVGDHDVLFCCDVVSGTPFNVAATICAEKSNYCCVGGLNTMAYMTITFELEGTAFEVADTAVETAKEAIMRFPPAEM